MKIKIDKIVHNGSGIGRINNKVFFIPYTLPDEIIDIDITEEKKSYNIGKIKKILEPSPNRIIPKCPLFMQCGGCDFQHISYDYQADIKKNIIDEFLLKAEINVLNKTTFVKSPDIFNYRNSAKFHIFNYTPSFFAKNSKNFLPIKYCDILDDNINNFIGDLKLEKHIDTISVKIDNQNNLSTNLLSTNNKKNRLCYKLNSLNIEFDYRIFFQVNNSIIPIWLETIKKYIELYPKKHILDLYSGVGIISFYLASQFKDIKKISSVEIDNTAVNFAKQNRNKNKINKIHFVAGKVERVINNYEHADIVVLNPPRSGVKKNILNKIIKINSGIIIYSSCEISTFIRDAKILTENGFELEYLTGFDMFPQTYHFETLGLFKKG